MAYQTGMADEARDKTLADADAPPALVLAAADQEAWQYGYLAALTEAGLLRPEDEPAEIRSTLKDHTVYVSIDGGPFFAYLPRTTDTSLVYAGEAGEEVRFVVVSCDNAGNVGMPPDRVWLPPYNPSVRLGTLPAPPQSRVESLPQIASAEQPSTNPLFLQALARAQPDVATNLPPTGKQDLGLYAAFRPDTRLYISLPDGRRAAYTFAPELEQHGDVAYYRPAWTPEAGVDYALQTSPGDMQYDAPGLEVPAEQTDRYRAKGLEAGQNFWSLPSTGGRAGTALQVAMQQARTRLYTYEVSHGIYEWDGEKYTPVSDRSRITRDRIAVVNQSASPFGAGWGLAGLYRLVVEDDGYALLIDGNGTAGIFTPPPVAGDPYTSPAGDFSVLMQDKATGRFFRVTPDGTVYQFTYWKNDKDEAGIHLLSLIQDRNENKTRFVYTEDRLHKIVDPVGLETRFTYVGGRVSEITDPAGQRRVRDSVIPTPC